MGNVIRVPENYTSYNVASKVKEAAQIMGEEMIGLVTYRVGIDELTQPRCVCFNDVYDQTQNYQCPYCYGTTFAGGIKESWRTWGIINDDKNRDLVNSEKQGIFNTHKFSAQVEPFPSYMEGDFIVRVHQWDTNRAIPLTLAERYVITDVKQYSIRTGNRYGLSNQDQISQELQLDILPASHPIYKFDVKPNETYPRWDGEPR